MNENTKLENANLFIDSPYPFYLFLNTVNHNLLNSKIISCSFNWIKAHKIINYNNLTQITH